MHNQVVTCCNSTCRSGLQISTDRGFWSKIKLLDVVSSLGSEWRGREKLGSLLIFLIVLKPVRLEKPFTWSDAIAELILSGNGTALGRHPQLSTKRFIISFLYSILQCLYILYIHYCYIIYIHFIYWRFTVHSFKMHTFCILSYPLWSLGGSDDFWWFSLYMRRNIVLNFTPRRGRPQRPAMRDTVLCCEFYMFFSQWSKYGLRMSKSADASIWARWIQVVDMLSIVRQCSAVSECHAATLVLKHWKTKVRQPATCMKLVCFFLFWWTAASLSKRWMSQKESSKKD